MAAKATDSPPELSALEASLWRDYVRRRCGIFFSEGRLRVLTAALRSRLKVSGAAGFTDYYHHVAHHPEGEVEWLELRELLLNKETSFFRHPASYEVLVEHALPELRRQKHSERDNVLRLWSVGCSTGQEAYSLTMAALEAPGGAGWQVRTTGTDLSPVALQRARAAVYRPYEVRSLPEPYHGKYLIELRERAATWYRLSDEVRERVVFQSFHLTDPATYPVEAQDAAFCQNVLIYFPLADRAEIIRNLCERLRPGGYLFLAPAEAVGLKLAGVEAVPRADASVFRRS